MDQILPEFQNFLHSKKLVPQKHVSFYALWVNKFLYYSNNNQSVTLNHRIEKFLSSLKEKKSLAYWQIQQAETALTLYIQNFLNNDTSTISPNEEKVPQLIHSLEAAVKKMREAIRLKHYSYRTERSYIDWTKRFYTYVIQENKEKVETSGPDAADVKNYLSHLALKHRVSSSTQNQAFNALLFLFREILEKDLSGLGKTVRAKRGPKLPTVLSVDEVKELFQYIEEKHLLMVELIYGAGLRLMELARLRIKDIDFESNLLFIRSGKGDKDRSTLLPEHIKSKLFLRLEKVKTLHIKDLKAGHGEVYLPNALDRKYPNMGKEWGWQYAFPSASLSVDPRSGKVRRHHINEKTIQNAVKKAKRRSTLTLPLTMITY